MIQKHIIQININVYGINVEPQPSFTRVELSCEAVTFKIQKYMDWFVLLLSRLDASTQHSTGGSFARTDFIFEMSSFILFKFLRKI